MNALGKTTSAELEQAIEKLGKNFRRNILIICIALTIGGGVFIATVGGPSSIGYGGVGALLIGLALGFVTGFNLTMRRIVKLKWVPSEPKMTQQKIFCISCGRENLSNSNYCDKCGKRLEFPQMT